MKIFCEYCGAQFESEVANFCPACGAAFSDNDQIEHKLQHQKQLDRLEIEEQEMDLRERQAQIDTIHRRNRSANSAEKMSRGCLGAFIACGVIIVLTGVGLAVLQVFSEMETEREERKTDTAAIAEAQPEEVDVPVSAGFNEYAQTVNYSVICDSIEIVDRYPFEPTEGYEYVSFHLLVKNTSTEEIETTNDIICLADGIITTYTWHTDRKEMPEIALPVGVSAEGYICFEVPVDAEQFELRYGDYVTIYIENNLMEREQ